MTKQEKLLYIKNLIEASKAVEILADSEYYKLTLEQILMIVEYPEE